jgi:hypothetical protein
MSNLAPGTVQFGLPYDIDNQIGQMSYEKVNRIIGPARSNRIDTLDTALAYGQIEVCIGQIGVRGFYVTIKLPALPESFTDVGRSCARTNTSPFATPKYDGCLWPITSSVTA